jgi:hypothetical protein
LNLKGELQSTPNDDDFAKQMIENEGNPKNWWFVRPACQPQTISGASTWILLFAQNSTVNHDEFRIHMPLLPVLSMLIVEIIEIK